MDRSEDVKIHGGFVLGFLIFLPVGIVLLLLRFVLHAKYNHLRDKDYRLTGHVLMTMFVFLMLLIRGSMEGGEGFGAIFITFFIIFGVPALIFYGLAYSRKRKMEALYKAYYRLVIEQGYDTVATLSQLTGVSVRNVREDIRHMVVTGQLPDATLTKDGDIVLPGRTPRSETQANDSAAQQAAAAQFAGPPKSVACSGCGATVNLYPGQTTECDFCGTILNDEDGG